MWPIWGITPRHVGVFSKFAMLLTSPTVQSFISLTRESDLQLIKIEHAPNLKCTRHQNTHLNNLFWADITPAFLRWGQLLAQCGQRTNSCHAPNSMNSEELFSKKIISKTHIFVSPSFPLY